MSSGLETAQDCMLKHRLEAPDPGKTKPRSLVSHSSLDLLGHPVCSDLLVD